jgi:4-hydroxy-3-methylbut-2-en-1-yl diphosphate reductase
MKFTTAALVATIGTASAFVPYNRAFVRPQGVLFSTTEETRGTTKKEDRLKFMKSDKFHRRGFKEVREKVERDVQEQYQSEVVGELKSSNYVVEKDGVKVHLAKDFGFCWGVERSIALAKGWRRYQEV